MQKFEFRLASLLRLRTIRLAAEQEKLAAALAEITRLEQALITLEKERIAEVAFAQQTSDAANWRSLAAYLLGHKTRVAKANQTLAAARQLAAEQRRRVVIADRDERLLLKLQEKQRAEWQRAVDRELEVLAQESWTSVHFKPP